ncbi:TonB-dependent receptor [Polaribacter pectinis]|uniref:TonB-dependent receptor n=1 Tax=Polaribacter pectinis TaxID=2738844 RepID=A0A7G9L6W0_9FLAO|nr:TonB-dependent receptor [Polaribacter pectinis]QNM84359.1 TonB-dependent receptor [Polaribacter pectinis]
MKKGFTILLILLGIFSAKAQEEPIEKVKDTVKTEVVEVVTKYNPKIADAKKIKKNPTLKIFEKSKKKKLEYTIFSAPVASTFIPKSGVVKGIDVGVKERIYKNYLAVGYGNYATPFVETFLHHSTRFENEFGLSAKYLASEENVRKSVLNSTFSNFNVGAFYKQEDRYFDWKVSLNSERNQYNWYGLPEIVFAETTVNSINEEQTYNYFNVIGEFTFKDSYIDFGKISASYFTDDYNSTEILAKFDAKLDFPLDFIKPNLNDISIKTSVEYLKGEFKNSYKDNNPVKYSIITVKINPEYKIAYLGFAFKAGLKTYVSLDSENDASNIFLIPDVLLQRPIIKEHLNIYGGFSGDLHTNTYKSFTEENPFISPTLFITQTLEESNWFLGFNGNITNDISFNLKASAKNEEDKPLFLRNASKSDGSTAVVNNSLLKGYEFGNSFSVYYDDVKTTSLFAEVQYDFSKRITFTTQIQFDNYTVTNALTEWNLPTLQASLKTEYKKNKWYASANAFYVSERKDGLYNGEFPSSFSGIQTIDSFIDVNLNGGYHFNDKFSAFLKLNNVLNTEYQRFANFDTQGFQALAGITYKFDF